MGAALQGRRLRVLVLVTISLVAAIGFSATGPARAASTGDAPTSPGCSAYGAKITDLDEKSGYPMHLYGTSADLEYSVNVQCFGRSNFTGTFNLNIWGPQVNFQRNSSGSANHKLIAGWHFDAPTIRFRFTVTPYDDEHYKVEAGGWANPFIPPHRRNSLLINLPYVTTEVLQF
jgi:hypothetical protein